MNFSNKNRIKYFLMGSLIALIGFTNCSPEEILEDKLENIICTGVDWKQEVAGELNNWEKAASDYNADPSKENCDSYKGTGISYLDALKILEICVPEKEKKEYDKEVADTKKEVDAINCE